MSETLQAPRAKASHKTIRIVKHPLFLAAIILIVAAAGVYTALKMIEPRGQQIDTSQYQAVYTTGGQLFFGKLQSTDGNYLTLKSPYTAQTAAASTDANQTGEGTTTLVKVSSQMYGPDDSMSIRSDQVVFWQNLRDDSKVMQAIKAKQ